MSWCLCLFCIASGLDWEKLANRALRLRKGAIITVNIWTIVFIILLLCVQLPLHILAAQNFRAQALFWINVVFQIWYFVLACAAFTNLLAFIEVTKLKWKRHSRKSTDRKTKVDVIIDRIQKTSLALVILLVVTVNLMWYLLPVFHRTFVSDPHCDVDSYNLALRFEITFWLLSFITCLWFVSPSLHFSDKVAGEEQNGQQARMWKG
jgi:MFS family permease